MRGHHADNQVNNNLGNRTPAAGDTGSAGQGAYPQKPADSSSDRPPALLRQWQRGLHIAHVAHTRAAVFYDRRARGLGVATTVISTIVGTSLFASIAGSADVRVLAVAAVLSLLVPPRGFEPLISTLKGWRPRPLDDEGSERRRVYQRVAGCLAVSHGYRARGRGPRAY